MEVTTAHPRSRGENSRVSTMRTSPRGSSPLTRGKPSADDGGERVPRLIPAHAGKTSGILVLGVSGTAHPRSRGENACSRLPRRAGRGSSPLTRGKPRRSRAELSYTGLIPAHAGKTHPVSGAYYLGTAHPRSRGENTSSGCWRARPRGSSPLTRGKRQPGAPQRAVEGLIPAHAGKTGELCRCAGSRRAHPRSRGENA